MTDHVKPGALAGAAGATCFDATGPVLLCFSHLRWDFVRQRPQHLMSRAARNRRVVFFEEPLCEDIEAPMLRFAGRENDILVATPVLPPGADEIPVLRQQLETLVASFAGAPLTAWYYTPMSLLFSDHITPDVVVYDNMDELSAFRGAPAGLLACEEELMRRADLVFTGGVGLFEAKRGRHPSIHPFPSSIDVAHFGRARAVGPDPADQGRIPQPRLGFFGVIDERMDLGLVASLAAARPDWHLVMIGPVAKIEESSLPRAANIHWLGLRPYADLPRYLAHWSVGIMPFAMNEATRFISPTKTPEFLAAGVPVVSTPIRDVVRPYGEKGLVAIADTPDAFIAACDTLVEEGPATGWLDRVDAHLGSMSWDRTWSSMERLIDAVAGRASMSTTRRLDAAASA